jgi:predicted nuclease of predicted toxin-antitoxin system
VSTGCWCPTSEAAVRPQYLSVARYPTLSDLFPNSQHVFIVHLHEQPDLQVWEYAREHGFTIVSKDADFVETSLQRGFPPKVVWLRLGNCTTAQIETLIRSHHLVITALEHDDQRGILSLFARAAG